MPFSYIQERGEIERAVSERKSNVEGNEEPSEPSPGGNEDSEVEVVERFSEAFGLSKKEFGTLVKGSVFEFKNGELIARPI